MRTCGEQHVGKATLSAHDGHVAMEPAAEHGVNSTVQVWPNQT